MKIKKYKNYGIVIIFLLCLFGVVFYSNFDTQSSRYNDSSNQTLLSSYLKQNLNCSTANVSIYAEKEFDRLGYSLSGVGDVNGDDLEDFLVSARYFDNSSTGNEGKVYLFLGEKSTWDQNINTSKANASFIGERNNDQFGIKVAGAGDVNNDGLNDFLISSINNDQGGENAGKIYLFFGKETGWEKNRNCSTADATFIGEYANDIAGYSIDGVGDVNGDNYDDILISAIGYNSTALGDEGKIYLFFGKSNNWQNNINCSMADVMFFGEVAGDETGGKVSNAGDINNDGYCDFLISSTNNDQAGSYAGKVYLFFGKSSNWNTEINCSDANASFIGESLENRAGWSISGAGDVNSDGFDDFLIGAPFNDENGYRSGKTYLFFGKETDWNQNVNCSEANVSFLGETEYLLSGSSVSSAGDINNDNYDDILISAPLFNQTKSYVGKVCLIYGKNSNWEKQYNLDQVNASFFGERESDFLGQGDSIAGVGDVNGDKCDDFIISSRTNDDIGINAGKLYLFFGPNPLFNGGGNIPSYNFWLVYSILSSIGIISLKIMKNRSIKN